MITLLIVSAIASAVLGFAAVVVGVETYPRHGHAGQIAMPGQAGAVMTSNAVDRHKPA